MTTFLQKGAEKVLQGVTTLEEVLRVTRIIIRRETDLET
jgi:type II secretory ATPase GspE/PulE/Tfp pilus assembly ATPase PilB-like protein